MNDNLSPRILITRLSAIGDTILTLPVACALRQRFPQAFIAWVVEPAAAPIVQGHECIDEVVVVPKRWLKSPREVLRVRKQLRDLRCSIAIDPQSLSKSAIAGWLSGAKQRIGFAKPEGRELSLWLNNQLVSPDHEHVVDSSLELLKPLGIESCDVEFRLPRNEFAKRSIHQFVCDSHLGRGFAVINPGAGWDSRMWALDRFGKVARHMGERWNLPSVIAWAGDRERQMAETIRAFAGGHAHLAPKTSLLELAELLDASELYVGCDTGPMHMAAAVGTPCVGLFGTTRWQHSGPYGSQHVPVQEYYQAGSSRERRQAGNDAMQAIGIEAVTRACDEILDRKSRFNGLRCAA